MKKNKLSSNLNTMQNLFLNKDRKFEVNENYFKFILIGRVTSKLKGGGMIAAVF